MEVFLITYNDYDVTTLWIFIALVILIYNLVLYFVGKFFEIYNVLYIKVLFLPKNFRSFTTNWENHKLDISEEDPSLGKKNIERI